MKRKVFAVGDRVRFIKPKRSEDYFNYGRWPDKSLGTVIPHDQSLKEGELQRKLDAREVYVRIDGMEGFECWVSMDWLERVSTKSAVIVHPKFILQYELDSDPFELIYSEKELRARIAELAENPRLKRDSIKVYDIKRVRTVKLGVKITISK
jgi:hypothetical protein